MDTKNHDLIDSFREEISKIDREIFSLIKKRESFAKKIGGIKRKLNMPDHDEKREKAVYEKAIALAKELDLPLNFVTTFQKLIVDASLSRQEQDRISNSFKARSRSIAVLGGAGRLGTWLSEFFIHSGHKVFVIDKVKPLFSCPHASSIESLPRDCEIIIIATPLRDSIKIIDEILDLDLKNLTIFDMISIKSPIHPHLLKLKNNGAKVSSIHPMFAPSVELLFGKHVIRCSLGDKEADLLCEELFGNTSLKIVDMDIHQHDKTISYLLSLSHLVNIIFVCSLRKGGIDINTLKNFSSPTFADQLEIASRVFAENPHLYYEIQTFNPQNHVAHQELLESLKKVLSAVNTGEEDLFINLMKECTTYLMGGK